MQNKSLKDTLIDLYYSGHLVPVWEEDDGRFVVDFIISVSARVEIGKWFLLHDIDIVSDTLANEGPKMAEFTLPEELGHYVATLLRDVAVDWAQRSDDWDEARAHITELENSR